MGYYVSVADSGTFQIKADQLANVYEALIRLNDHDELKNGGSYDGSTGRREVWFSWMPADYSYLKTAADILAEVGFEFEQDDDGTLHSFRYDNKTGCEDVFLAACAPFVADDSFINWQGEDGDHYQFFFHGGVMYVVRGRTVFDSDPRPLAVNHYSRTEDGGLAVRQIIVSNLLNGQEV